MVAALAKHDVQIRDFQKVVSGDGKCGPFLLASSYQALVTDDRLISDAPHPATPTTF